MKKLTPKQKAFADEYIKSGNAYQSAIKAGYSENYSKGNAIKLLENVSVKSYIDAKMAEIESHKIADAKEVLEFYTAVMRGEQKETVFVQAGKGYAKEQKEADLKTRISAAREIMNVIQVTIPLLLNRSVNSKLKQIQLKLKQCLMPLKSRSGKKNLVQMRQKNAQTT